MFLYHSSLACIITCTCRILFAVRNAFVCCVFLQQQDYSIKFEHLQYDKNAFKFLQIATANINEDNFVSGDISLTTEMVNYMKRNQCQFFICWISLCYRIS